VVHIGRDETNDIVIDSLAVAPTHVAIQIRDSQAQIKQLSDAFPLVVNANKVKISELHDGDEITIGKHTIIYNVSEPLLSPDRLMDNGQNEVNVFNRELDKDANRTATLQVTNGPNIGKILTIKNTMTRLGNAGSGVAVIAKRKEGYFVSVLENTGNITVNGEPLGDKTIKLESNDVLVVNNASLQFFLDPLTSRH
jgi:hypothetical protein